MPHPCCGKDLRSATKLVAFIGIIWASVFIAVAIVILITSATNLIVTEQEPVPLNNSGPSKAGGDTETAGGTKIALGGLIVGTIILVVKILQLILAIYLWQAADERNHYKCKTWIYITCVFVVITIMNFLFDVISVEGSKLGSVICVIGITLHIYFLWVVAAFKQELQRGNAQPEVDSAGLKA